jgi:geranylgeranyl pyrophosphate synthase
MNPDLFERLATALVRHAPAAADSEPHLRAALGQAVAHPGKLLRAALVLTGAEHHGLAPRHAERLACAVEYFHVASLVLDDLPCMDDAQLRRGQPCVHRRHGDATAILAALALINRAYALVGEALAAQPQRVRSAATAALDRALGLAGLVGGQAWDLAFAQTDRTAARVSRIAAAKTGALFQLAVLLPAALARPTAAERRHLRALCVYWGQLFQIADDLRDVASSPFVEGKTTGRDAALTRPNLALALGFGPARKRLARLHAQGGRALGRLETDGGARWSYLRRAGAALVVAVALPRARESAAA